MPENNQGLQNIERAINDLALEFREYFAPEPWESWTPSYANLTIGNGTVKAFFKRIGKTVHFRWVFQLGSTSVVGSGPTITLPIPAIADSYDAGAVQESANIGHCKLLDSGTANYFANLALTTTGTVFSPQVIGSAGTYTNVAGISATVPFTWGTGDAMFCVGTYECE
jgi:hypothetical protein